MHEWQIAIRGFRLGVLIRHAHMAAKDRIDDDEQRRETLIVGVTVDYRAHDPKDPESLEGLWSYGGLVRFLESLDGSVLTGTLESLSNRIAEAVDASLVDSRIAPILCSVTVERPELRPPMTVHIRRTWNRDGLAQPRDEAFLPRSGRSPSSPA